MTPSDRSSLICDEIIRLNLERLSWVLRDAEKVREWRLQDEAEGIIWGDAAVSRRRSGTLRAEPVSRLGQSCLPLSQGEK